MRTCLVLPSFGGFVFLKPGWISSEGWLDKINRNTLDVVGIVLYNLLEYYGFAFHNSLYNLSCLQQC